MKNIYEYYFNLDTWWQFPFLIYFFTITDQKYKNKKGDEFNEN